MLKMFETVAALFLGSEVKFRRLEEEVQKWLRDDVSSEGIEGLLEFYCTHKLNPSYAMLNVAGIYACSRRAEELLQKLN